MQLRGPDLRSVRQKALERLNMLGISTTLVVTVERGLNDGELGRIIDFALQRPAVRGVTIQAVQQDHICRSESTGMQIAQGAAGDRDNWHLTLPGWDLQEDKCTRCGLHGMWNAFNSSTSELAILRSLRSCEGRSVA